MEKDLHYGSVPGNQVSRCTSVGSGELKTVWTQSRIRGTRTSFAPCLSKSVSSPNCVKLFPELSTKAGLTNTSFVGNQECPQNSTRIGKDQLRPSNRQKEHSSRGKGCLHFQKNLREAATHLGRNGDHISALDFRHTLWQPAADMPGTSFRKSHFLQRRPLCSVVVAFVSSFSWLLCLEVV